MADKEYISNITLPNGETKYVKDEESTSEIESVKSGNLTVTEDTQFNINGTEFKLTIN